MQKSPGDRRQTEKLISGHSIQGIKFYSQSCMLFCRPRTLPAPAHHLTTYCLLQLSCGFEGSPRGLTPGPAVANQKGRSGLVSRRAGYYTKRLGAHDGDSFPSSFGSKKTRPVPRRTVSCPTPSATILPQFKPLVACVLGQLPALHLAQ
jgi:hypothetical protein